MAGAWALERVITYVAMPEPASVKFVVVITMPPSVLDVAGTETLPAGAVPSGVRVTAFAAVLPAESVSVSERAGLVAAAAQVNVDEVKFGAVVGVSSVCVQPFAASAG